MLCRNCNHNLSGEEDFCPHCGVPQKLTDVSISDVENINKEKTESNSIKKQDHSIFQNEPVYIYTDPPKEKDNKKSKVAIAFISLFIVTLLIIGVLTLGEYFQLTPAFSDLFQSEPSTTEPLSLETVVSDEYDNSLGLVPPDINFKSTLCTVMSEEGLSLRKGPDNRYAAIYTVPYGTNLQIIGKSLHNNLWGYVYIPSVDLYGWLLCSYLTEQSELNEPEITSQSQKESENKCTDPSDESPQNMSNYYATVTAEKGIYLRVGPGINYEAIHIVPGGEIVTVLSNVTENESWLYVSIGDKKGYINKAYIKENSL